MSDEMEYVSWSTYEAAQCQISQLMRDMESMRADAALGAMVRRMPLNIMIWQVGTQMKLVIFVGDGLADLRNKYFSGCSIADVIQQAANALRLDSQEVSPQNTTAHSSGAEGSDSPTTTV